MHELVKVKAEELFSLVGEILKKGENAWITVTGMSMYPFLREGRDSVELAVASFSAVKKGDIVLIRRESKEYVMHRLLKKEKDCFYMIGDAQQWVEGPIAPHQLIAYVTRIKRGEHIIDCNNMLLKCMVGLWLLVIPVRKKIIRVYRGIRQLLK